MNQDTKIRYSRNITLPQIGEEGQEKLLASKVLVVGAGGLGSPSLLYLAASGVGTLGIVDNDKVDLSNLQRQVLHETTDIGVDKVESAAGAIHDLNPEINVVPHKTRLDKKNVDKIIADYDIIVDGSDNIETRFLLNDKCYEYGITLVSAAIHGFTGQLNVFKAYQGEPHPCYRCIYPDIEGSSMPSCSRSGVLSPVAGVMGTMQAVEVIKELLEIGESLSGNMIIYEALHSKFRKVAVRRNKGCKCCSN